MTIENTEIININHFIFLEEWAGGGGLDAGRCIVSRTHTHLSIVVHVASFHGLLEIVYKLFAIIVRYEHFRLRFLVKGLIQSSGKVAVAQ